MGFGELNDNAIKGLTFFKELLSRNLFVNQFVTSVYVICNQIKEYIDNGKQYVKKKQKQGFMHINDGFNLWIVIMRSDSSNICDCNARKAYEGMKLKLVIHC